MKTPYFVLLTRVLLLFYFTLSLHFTPGLQSAFYTDQFVWESDGKYLFPELNFSQFVNQKDKILGRRLYSPSFKDVAELEFAELTFLIFHTFVCTFFSCELHLDICLPCQIYILQTWCMQSST